MKAFFKFLAVLNKTLLPKYYKTDLNKLSKFQKVIIAYKYWVTSNAISD